jgi:hypothetical protein
MNESENQRYEDGLTMQSLMNVIDRINDKITSCENRVVADYRLPENEIRGLKSALALIELEITRQRRAPNLKRMY